MVSLAARLVSRSANRLPSDSRCALLPRRVEAGAALLLGQHGDGLQRRSRRRDAGQRPARRLAVRLAVLGDLRQPLGVGAGPLWAGIEKFGVRWNTTSSAACLAITGIDWMPDDPVPMTPTRLPVKSTPSCGQRLVK